MNLKDCLGMANAPGLIVVCDHLLQQNLKAFGLKYNQRHLYTYKQVKINKTATSKLTFLLSKRVFGLIRYGQYKRQYKYAT